MGRVTQARQKEMDEALAALRVATREIDVIYTNVEHVSRSGLFRAIRPFIVVPGSTRPWDLTYLVARAGIGKASNRHGGIEMTGAGMDMAFALVYAIGRAVVGSDPWQCRGERCPSNEHVNPPRIETGADVWHNSDGGYRFRKETL